MIYDTLENLKNYIAVAPDALARVIAHLDQLDAKTAAAKSTLIAGKLFVLVHRYETRNAPLESLEIHEDFADIQLVLSGREDCFYSLSEGLDCTREMADDYALFRADPEKAVKLALEPGKFVLFMPGEGHMGGLGDVQHVVKVVVKLHRSLLE